MSTRSVVLSALLLALVSTACQPPAQEPAGLSEEDVAVIRNLVEQEHVQIVLAGDAAAAAAAIHTEDAVRLPPNAPLIKGRADIEASFAALNLTDLSQTLEEVDGRGDLAYARFTYEATWTVESVPITDQGKAIAIYQRQPDGSWLCKVVIWNSDLPLPEQSAEAET